MELPDSHIQVLKVLASQPTETEHLDPDILEELRRWGMVMANSLEVTGTGARIVGKGERGVLE